MLSRIQGRSRKSLQTFWAHRTKIILSYQHIYHAGNFADVQKHVGLMLLLEKLGEKPKPWVYFDTHAGRGMYDLASTEANKTGEYKAGIGAIANNDFKSALGRYMALVDTVRQKYGETRYPGSPAIARELRREGDRIVLSELHPGEIEHLRETFKRDRVEIHRHDALKGLIGLLPPKTPRGLVLIDPAYEVKTEYSEIAPTLAKAIKRWSTGVFAVWYPILKEPRHHTMVAAMKDLPGEKLFSEFRVPQALRDHRMVGTGLAVFNPPWKFGEQLGEAMNELNAALYGGKGSHQVT